MRKFTFVVLHYRDVKNTKACLDSLCKMKLVQDVSVEVSVVDNNSPDPFPKEKITCAIGPITIQKNEKNLGYSGGMNSGMIPALQNGADYVVVVNNDTVFDVNFLKEVVAFLNAEKKTGIIVPKIYFYPGSEFHHDRYKDEERGKVIWYAGGKIDWANVISAHRGVDEVDFGQHDKERQTIFATGCCIVFPREILENVGYFDDTYYLYYEDIDMSMRVKRAGYEIFFLPEAILWHKNAKSAGGVGSSLQDYYISRNRMLFAMRYAPTRAKLSIVRESLKLLLTGRTWQKRGITDFYLRNLGKGSYETSST